MRIDLLPGQIHLWFAFYDQIQDPQLHVRYRQLLSDSERVQEPRFHFAADRRRYLVTRAMVRTVLSRYAALSPVDWRFKPNAYGRPCIENAEGMHLRFNVSHTHHLIVLGVTREREVGVDIENLRARSAPLDIADRYFAPEEVTSLRSMPLAGQHERFFEYWTFKESYIKARGMGLSIPLDKFSFDLTRASEVRFGTDPQLMDLAARWQFWSMRVASDYLVALCAQKIEGVSALVLRTVVPLASEDLFATDPVRTSAL
jgi:4'-phosphopantetheinyl transferase